MSSETHIENGTALNGGNPPDPTDLQPPVPQSGHKSGYSRAKARIEQLATTNRHLKNRIRNMAEHIDALVTERDALQTRNNKLRRENEEALLFCERLVEERR